MIQRHFSELMAAENATEEHQRNVDFLEKQSNKIEAYPYALEAVYMYAKQLLEEHLVLFAQDETKAARYLHFIRQASWYMMRLRFNPQISFQAHWQDSQETFEVKLGERDIDFDYPEWYQGIMAAVILREADTIRAMTDDYTILHLLESDDSPRDDVQFRAMFYEVWLYYLTDLYGLLDEAQRAENREVMTLKLGNLLRYAEILTEKYALDKPCKHEKFLKPPKGKKLDEYYYHYFCHWMIPCLHALNALWEHDEASFASAYEKGVLMHQRYWDRETDHDGLWEENGYYLRNDYIGYFSFTLTALASLAYDEGFKLPVQTDYCPDFLIKGAHLGIPMQNQ